MGRTMAGIPFKSRLPRWGEWGHPARPVNARRWGDRAGVGRDDGAEREPAERVRGADQRPCRVMRAVAAAAPLPLNPRSAAQHRDPVADPPAHRSDAGLQPAQPRGGLRRRFGERGGAVGARPGGKVAAQRGEIVGSFGAGAADDLRTRGDVAPYVDQRSLLRRVHPTASGLAQGDERSDLVLQQCLLQRRGAR